MNNLEQKLVPSPLLKLLIYRSEKEHLRSVWALSEFVGDLPFQDQIASLSSVCLRSQSSNTPGFWTASLSLPLADL